jgi:hypothetical protein
MKKSFTFGYVIIAVLLAFVWMSLHASTSAAVPAMILTDTPTATPSDTPTNTPTDTPVTPPTNTPPPQDKTPAPGPTDTPALDLTPEGVLTLPVTGQGALMPLLVLLVVGVGLLGLARLRHSHLR